MNEHIKIKKTLEYDATKKGIPGKICLSEVIQGKWLTPPKKNGRSKNKSAKAIPYLEQLCECGFENMEEEKKRGRTIKVFCKTKWNKLDEAQLDMIKQLKVDKEH